MRHLVLDASIVGPWLWPATGPQARLLAEFETGQLTVTVPGLLFLEVLNVAGRQRRWNAELLLELVDRLERMRFEVLEPELVGVARWVGRGLTAYDASYVALAEQARIPLLTMQREILELAPGVAAPL